MHHRDTEEVHNSYEGSSGHHHHRSSSSSLKRKHSIAINDDSDNFRSNHLFDKSSSSSANIIDCSNEREIWAARKVDNI